MKALLNKYKEIISYLFWGIMTTVVSWGSYSILIMVLEKKNIDLNIFHITVSSSILISNVLSWVLAVAFAYVTNKIWVFHSTSWKPSVVRPEVIKFVSARLITGIIEMAGVPLLVGIGLDQTILGVQGAWAKVLVSIIVVIVNYIWSKFFIFQKK